MKYPKNRLKADPDRKCLLDDCEEKAYAKHYCKFHYSRDRMGRNMQSPKRDAIDYYGWIEKHKSYEGHECLEWPFSKTKDGYGRLYVGKKSRPAHREMCIATHGLPKSDLLHTAHNCGNPCCVNPNHLRWATAKENMADKKIHGTNNNGSKHGLAKLTESQAKEIKYSTGPLAVAAKKYGVSCPTISEIRNGKRWSHV